AETTLNSITAARPTKQCTSLPRVYRVPVDGNNHWQGSLRGRISAASHFPNLAAGEYARVLGLRASSFEIPNPCFQPPLFGTSQECRYSYGLGATEPNTSRPGQVRTPASDHSPKLRTDRASHSAARCAPFSATDRRMKSVRTISPTAITANTQKTSK